MKSKREINPQVPEVTVFHGSILEEVEHAKSFWKSLTLQPPLESRLVSAEIRQRLRVAPPPTRLKCRREREIQKDQRHEQLLEKMRKREADEERMRYLTLAEKREAVLDLLYKQRAQRLDKEMIRNKVSQK